jgi:hypothetical protein
VAPQRSPCSTLTQGVTSRSAAAFLSRGVFLPWSGWRSEPVRRGSLSVLIVVVAEVSMGLIGRFDGRFWCLLRWPSKVSMGSGRSAPDPWSQDGPERASQAEHSASAARPAPRSLDFVRSGLDRVPSRLDLVQQRVQLVCVLDSLVMSGLQGREVVAVDRVARALRAGREPAQGLHQLRLEACDRRRRRERGNLVTGGTSGLRDQSHPLARSAPCTARVISSSSGCIAVTTSSVYPPLAVVDVLGVDGVFGVGATVAAPVDDFVLLLDPQPATRSAAALRTMAADRPRNPIIVSPLGIRDAHLSV